MMKQLLLLTFSLFYVCLPRLLSQDRQPNIILIMADDLGTEAVGCYGGTSYQTPVLDEMARTGARFRHAYAYPLCTPTRVSLMTGKYNFRNWKAFGILDPEEKTVGHFMQEAGYATCMVGKWQLQSYAAHTEDKGSRYADPLIYQNGSFLNHTQGKYGPDLFTDYLNDFVTRHKDEPFFVYYPMALTHGPFVPPPDSKAWQDPTLRHQQDPRFFGDMVEYMDKLLGKIMDNLKQTDLEDNTLVIFYSDNGTHQIISSNMGKKKVQGGKGLNIDAGTRIPMIVKWPGHIEEGMVSDAMIAPSDFLPTIREAIGQPLSSRIQTDGESFLPELLGEETERRDWVFIDHNPRPGWDKQQFVPTRFVKGSRYKLYGDGRFYDIEKDELEEKPIALSDLSQQTQALHERYSGILDSLRRYSTIGSLEVLDPAFHEIVPANTKIEVIADGFFWCEGPVWVPDQ